MDKTIQLPFSIVLGDFIYREKKYENSKEPKVSYRYLTTQNLLTKRETGYIIETELRGPMDFIFSMNQMFLDFAVVMDDKRFDSFTTNYRYFFPIDGIPHINEAMMTYARIVHCYSKEGQLPLKRDELPHEIIKFYKLDRLNKVAKFVYGTEVLV